MQVMAGAAVGGAEAFFERLVAALAARSVYQTVVLRNHPNRIARLRRAGVDPATLRFGGPLDIVTRFKLGRLIAARRPQVVLSWMNRATLAVLVEEGLGDPSALSDWTRERLTELGLLP